MNVKCFRRFVTKNVRTRSVAITVVVLTITTSLKMTGKSVVSLVSIYGNLPALSLEPVIVLKISI